MEIEHVVVLAMENRSFDHMLGYLDHPNKNFDGVRNKQLTNPGYNGGPDVPTSPDAKYVLPYDPDHSHDSVMQQLALDANGQPHNSGFVEAYERKGRGLAKPEYSGLLAPIVRLFHTVTRRPKPDEVIADRGPLIMLGQAPERVPVLSTLALEFAVCTRWFCSVPGETWPNRNFMHAATSDGETNIDPRFYKNKTIFEQLEEASATWNIYYDDTPQVWAFPELWEDEKRRANWFHISHFAENVATGKLPNYTFIEPNHRPPFHVVSDPPTIDRGDASNNQHPANNRVSNASYDSFETTEPVDFVRGEALIANIYETLRSNPEVFEKTLFLVTYDEHGGCYDHVPPPCDVANPGQRHGIVNGILRRLLHPKSKHFDFTMLGPRVPAVVISPFIDKNTVSPEVFDHSSIPATIRHLFASHLPPLTARDANAARFADICNRSTARTDLPDLSAHTLPIVQSDDVTDLSIAEQGNDTYMPEYYEDLVQLSDQVRTRMQHKNIAKVATSASDSKRLRAHRTTTAFRAAAHNARN